MAIRKVVAAGSLAATTLIGGAIGASIVGSADAASTPTPTPSSATGSNEELTHEGGETATRETAENNGTAGFGRHGDHMRGGSNEDPAHEAAESPERAAEEGDPAQTGGSAPSTDATPSPTASPGI